MGRALPDHPGNAVPKSPWPLSSKWVIRQCHATSDAPGWQRLFDRLAEGLRNPVGGIMMHHPRMNAAVFDFLDRLLEILNRRTGITKTDLRDLPKP